MKKEMDIQNYRDWTVTTEKGIKKGLFFTRPLRQFNYNCYTDSLKTSAYDYKNKLNNPLFKLFQIIIGNKHVIENIDEWIKDLDFYGFSVNKLVSPIYFTRSYRKLVARNTSADSGVSKVVSYGYESPYENTSGGCEKEITLIFTDSGKQKIVNRKQYKYTYDFIVKEKIFNYNFKYETYLR